MFSVLGWNYVRAWKNAPSTCMTHHVSPVVMEEQMDDSITSKFDWHCLSLMSQEKHEGWEAESHWYLKELPTNVRKDSDILQWWQVCFTGSQLLVLLHILTDSRITAMFTQHSSMSHYISCPSRHPQLCVSGSFLLVGKLQLRNVHSWVLNGLRSYSWWSLHGGSEWMTLLCTTPVRWRR